MYKLPTLRHPKGTSISQILHLPAICMLCRQAHKGHVAVCEACSQLLTPLGSACQICAIPLPLSDFLICGDCIKKKPAFHQVITAHRFEEPLRTILHEFKYHAGLYLTSFLGELMLTALPKDYVATQCLIPVPMHARRLRRRGFNQAAILARFLARRLQIPCDLTLCNKIKNTATQAELDGLARRKNLHAAFTVLPHSYQHITLVDDLLTTGSTANELAYTLKMSGATRVDVWCCARATMG